MKHLQALEGQWLAGEIMRAFCRGQCLDGHISYIALGLYLVSPSYIPISFLLWVLDEARLMGPGDIRLQACERFSCLGPS